MARALCKASCPVFMACTRASPELTPKEWPDNWDFGLPGIFVIPNLCQKKLKPCQVAGSFRLGFFGWSFLTSLPLGHRTLTILGWPLGGHNVDKGSIYVSFTASVGSGVTVISKGLLIPGVAVHRAATYPGCQVLDRLKTMPTHQEPRCSMILLFTQIYMFVTVN